MSDRLQTLWDECVEARRSTAYSSDTFFQKCHEFMRAVSDIHGPSATVEFDTFQGEVIIAGVRLISATQGATGIPCFTEIRVDEGYKEW